MLHRTANSMIRHFKDGIADGFSICYSGTKQSFHSLGRYVSRQADRVRMDLFFFVPLPTVILIDPFHHRAIPDS